jgi:hypothetical protein
MDEKAKDNKISRPILALIAFAAVSVVISTATYVVGDLMGRAIIKIMFPSDTPTTEGSAE